MLLSNDTVGFMQLVERGLRTGLKFLFLTCCSVFPTRDGHACQCPKPALASFGIGHKIRKTQRRHGGTYGAGSSAARDAPVVQPAASSSGRQLRRGLDLWLTAVELRAVSQSPKNLRAAARSREQNPGLPPRPRTGMEAFAFARGLPGDTTVVSVCRVGPLRHANRPNALTDSRGTGSPGPTRTSTSVDHNSVPLTG